MKNFIISITSLTENFKKKILKLTGVEFEYITLSELKKLGSARAFWFLLGKKANSWIIATEDLESTSLLPILHMVSSLVLAKQKYHIDHHLNSTQFSSVKGFFSGIKLLIYTIYNLIYKEIVRLQLSRLKPPTEKKINFNNLKKVLYINANLWYGVKVGGSIGHIAGVINGLKKLGCKVIFTATSTNPAIGEDTPTHILSPLEVGLPPELNHYRFSNQIIAELSNLIARENPDFIYQRQSFANYTGVILARKHKIPLVMEYNGPTVWCAEKWGPGIRYPKLALLAEHVCLKHADRVVTISNVLKNQLVELGINKEKIFYYPNCVDPEIFNSTQFTPEETHAIRQQYGLPTNALVFTFIGTFGLWHGVELLSQVIVELVNTHSDFLDKYVIRFMLIGDGARAPAVRKILTEGHALDYCALTGLVLQKEAPRYLAASDVLLTPTLPNADGSPFFGSPTKLFEYMAAEKAIIASDLEQIGEILENSLHISQPISEYPHSSSKLALLCRPGNKEDLLNAILFLATNPEWRKILGQNARNSATEKYTWLHHVKEVLYSS